ncbi:unnamed protein product [Closterium sp. Yama58-4]|nr:unnamed protein product [Closterium sp. Yama58-4]
MYVPFRSLSPLYPKLATSRVSHLPRSPLIFTALSSSFPLSLSPLSALPSSSLLSPHLARSPLILPSHPPSSPLSSHLTLSPPVFPSLFPSYPLSPRLPLSLPIFPSLPPSYPLSPPVFLSLPSSSPLFPHLSLFSPIFYLPIFPSLRPSSTLSPSSFLSHLPLSPIFPSLPILPSLPPLPPPPPPPPPQAPPSNPCRALLFSFCTYPHLRSTHPSFPLSPSSPLPFSDSTLICSPHTYLIFPLLMPPLPPHPPLISLPSPTTAPPITPLSLTSSLLPTIYPPILLGQLSPTRPSSVPIHSLLIPPSSCVSGLVGDFI